MAVGVMNTNKVIEITLHKIGVRLDWDRRVQGFDTTQIKIWTFFEEMTLCPTS